MNFRYARGWLNARGRQRTDSTHVLVNASTLNRLAPVGETLRAARNALAVIAPDRLQAHVPPERFERYQRRVDEYRLPNEREARQGYGATIGTDGRALMAAADAATAPDGLAALSAISTLRRVWSQQFVGVEGHIDCTPPTNSRPPACGSILPTTRTPPMETSAVQPGPATRSI